MSRSFLLYFLVTILSASAQQLNTGIWKEKPTPIADTRYTLIDFADSIHGCLFTQFGNYISTTNGGKSWSVVKKLQNCTNIVKIKLINKEIIIAVDEMNIALPLSIKLHVSTDFGQNWNETNLPDSVAQRNGGTISILSDSIIGFVGQHYTLFKSINLGNTWDTVCILGANLYSNLSIFGKFNFVISGGGGFVGSGFVKQSNDEGKTWHTIFDQSQLSRVSTEYYSTSLGYLNLGYGDDPVKINTILYNPQNNNNLIYNNVNAYGALYSNGESILISFSSGLKKSENDSTYNIGSWIPGDIKIKKYITTGREYSWILGDSGRYFQRIDLLTRIRIINSENIHVAESFIIGAYPNPFNSSCNIDIKVHERIHNAKLLIYDVLGRKQKVLFEGEMMPGIHSYRWDGINENTMLVSSGIYFLVFLSSNNTYTQSLLFVK